MFPIRDDNPQILTPYATYLIVALNAAMWVIVQGMGSEPILSNSITLKEYAPRYEEEYCRMRTRYFPVLGHTHRNDPDALELVCEKEVRYDRESVDL